MINNYDCTNLMTFENIEREREREREKERKKERANFRSKRLPNMQYMANWYRTFRIIVGVKETE